MARWIENDAEWYEQRMVHCGSCGRLIAKHFLLAEIEGESKIFCGEACEQLYRDYLIPERGRDYRPPGDVAARYDDLMVK